jgi:SAM-dependent methyltransferase
MKILDVGCGNNKYESQSKKDRIIGIDHIPLKNVDVVHNLNRTPWPFKKEEFDLVIIKNVLEHLTDTVQIMQEIWRILKKKGIVEIIVPYHSSVGANTDPTHKINFAYRSLDFFVLNGSNSDFYTSKKFKLKSRMLKFHKYHRILEKLFNKFPRFYEKIFRYLIPAEEIKFILEK